MKARPRFAQATPVVPEPMKGSRMVCPLWEQMPTYFRTIGGGAVDKKKVSEHPIVQDDGHPTVKPLPVFGVDAIFNVPAPNTVRKRRSVGLVPDA